MNFQTECILIPLKVLVVNPLTPSGQMILTKILSGFIFGDNQLIDLILLVYSNETPAAERLKLELIKCAYACYNSITISSDLPSISDADVFCFLSNFYNLNKIELDKMDTDEQFDALYLIIKIANNLTGLAPDQESNENIKPVNKLRKPIMMADGLAAMDILISMSKNVSPDIFFCPTTIPDVAKTVLGEHLKVRCDVINNVFVWAANDEVLHVEIDTPVIDSDKVIKEFHCDDEMASREMYHSFQLDHTQFNPSWMKKEFIQKVKMITSKNPYGSIFRATLFARALKSIWTARKESEREFYCNMGVVSDGSLGTTKGRPYGLPLVFCGDSWRVNKCYEKTVHLKNELKRINKVVKEHHEILIPFCKHFLQQNVINQGFIPVPAESSYNFTSSKSSKTSVGNIVN